MCLVLFADDLVLLTPPDPEPSADTGMVSKRVGSGQDESQYHRG